ncbi:MAG: GTP 3',8-cyclase MoaA [Oscillospiraceae bacterium]
MEDTFGRKIDYIRISVTDRCNLRCRYCMPNGMENIYTCDEIMSYEEILRICRNLVKLGISKFKITGGEPLARIGIDNFIAKLKAMEGVQQVTLTTNGVLLDKYLDAFKKAEIDGINISLDTLDAKKYEEITGFNAFDKVVGAIEKAYDLGIKVKINVVPVRQYNINEIAKLAAIAKDKNIQVRFIELMPIGFAKDLTPIKNEEILEIIEKEFGKSKEYHEKRLGNGPAHYYKFDGFKGKIGLISAVSHKFCSECNRIRLTSYGDLKLCLCYDYGVNLKDIMRKDNISDSDLINIMEKEIVKKPKQHSFEHMEEEKNIENKKMFQIGG